MNSRCFLGLVISLIIVFIIVIYTTKIFQTPVRMRVNNDKIGFSSSRDFARNFANVTYPNSKKVEALFISKDTNAAFQLGFKHCNKTFQMSHYITVHDTKGRLGNNIFRLLALLSTAKEHCYTPVFTYKFFNITNSLFDLSNMKQISVIPKQWKSFKDVANGIYSPGIMTLDHRSNWSLHGFFQSWRYFGRHEAYIRSMLEFRKDVRGPVIKYMYSVANLRDKITICLHIRRGDLLLSTWQNMGFGVASVAYLNRSMQYMKNKFKDTPVAFIIISDDIEWCKNNIKNDTGNIYFSPFSKSKSADSAVKDMALLSYCDHSIITSGTFGWMGAWLGNGHVVYFKGFPIPGSWLERVTNRSDYYPPHWVGLI